MRRVWAFLAGGIVLVMLVGLWLPLPVLAAAPSISGVQASVVTDTAAVITWTTDIAATGNVDYGTTPGGPYTAYPGDTSADNTSHSVILVGLTANTTYYYKVRSWDGTDETTSAESSFKTRAFMISTVTASGITTGSATITWSTSVSATSNVDYGITDSYGSGAPVPADTSVDSTSHIVVLSGLNANTTYHYRARSSDGTNEEVSIDFTFKTAADTTAPVISGVTPTGTISTVTTATITWNTDELATSNVEYGLTAGYGSASAADTEADETGHTVVLTGLSPNTLYHYRVKSTDTSGNQAVSGDYTFSTAADTTAPVISSILPASGTTIVTSTTATITWNTDELATGNVDYGLSTSYDKIAPSPADATADNTGHSVVLSGLLPDTTYHYQVKSKDAYNNEAVLGDYTFKTAKDATSPEITNVLPASGTTITTSTTATITWTTNELATSNVDYGLTAGYGSSAPTPADTTADKTSHSVTLSGLLPDTTYHFCPKSSDASGNAATLVDYTFKTAADTTPPVITPGSVAPSGITIATSTTATITWSTNELATSNVEYGLTTSYGSTAPSPVDTTADKTSHSVTLSGLSPDTTYHYKVKSKDASNNEAVSGDYTFKTAADVTAPVISSILPASGATIGTSTTATITWSTNELATGNVDYGLTTGYGSSAPAVADALADNINHTVVLSGLTAGATYHYRVKSTDAAGIQALSADRTFTTSGDSTPPVISSVGEFGVTSTGAVINWVTDEPADTQVEYGLSTAYGSSTPLDTSLVTSHVVVLTGLVPGTTYHYIVKSRDAAGNLPLAFTDHAFTTAADTVAPSAPTLVAPADGGVSSDNTPTFDWSDVSDPSGVTYKLQVADNSGFSSPVVDQTGLAFSFYVPSTGLADAGYYWRVKAVDGSVAHNESSWTASWQYIVDTTAPAVTVASPNGGEVWAGGSSHNITWTATDGHMASSPITLEYYNGSSWVQIASGEANDGSYTWAVPSLNITTAKVRVKAIDTAGNIGSDESNASFTIDSTAPVISAVASSGITTGAATITWTTTENATSNVEYGTTTSYGSSAPASADTTADSTSHSVTLSGLSADTTYHYRVKSGDAAGNQAVSSDYSFTTLTANQNPAQPVNTSPADGATGVSLTPTLEASAFSDPDSGDTHAASQWVIASASGGTVFDSGTDTSDLTSIVVPEGKLQGGTTYSWKVRYQDSNGAWSDYSAVTSFTTKGGAGGGCGCSCSKSSVSASGLALGWVAIGVCWGTGYYFVKRISSRRRK